MSHTDFDNSRALILGLATLDRHKTLEFTVNVVETSGISVRGIEPLPPDVLETLHALHWKAGNGKENGVEFGWAEFYNLHYVDY